MIRTRALTKDFPVGRDASATVHAVRGIDLDVAPGELVAVLGPNGAGKTTTLRMLTTLIRPTSGTATVAGHDVVAEPDAVRHRIGYVGQGNGAGHAQRAVDELTSQGRIHGLDRRTARRRADELLDSLELGSYGARKVSDLSGGQRRRLDVAMGLVHAPSLLFLDEPSTGLDPHNRANLWDHVLRMREDSLAATGEPMTIVLTTHYLDEADTMAERVVVVDHGQVIADDTAENLKADLAGDRVVVTLAPPQGPAHDDAARLVALARRVEGFREATRTPDGAPAVGHDAAPTLEVRAERGDAYLPRLLRAADADGIAVETAQVHRPTLDDVFLALTGRSLREAGAATPTDAPAEGTRPTERTAA
ncbi:ABC-2 type transport system ATP-binding protein [Cellulosimicrobium cellulans]|uniref:ABC transporter n=1 Tax=Cellulosimicrobium cellulans TaxID=1710 RepID=A0A1Y0HS75_CELCE|nr:ATP-binding cassette domain-containing protein [Cellulosimicrobium cellulans]ARU50810.1 ABC transporter [Cellulosimicrobium cellulans]MBM7821216.1 ABC-2 type transport system ATP-binding protein [Cellulosimicrobium cellulans]